MSASRMYLAYAIIAVFSYLIINWGFNFVVQRVVIEGIDRAAVGGSGSGSKCPEDCTSVKELQQKLSDAVKNVATLKEGIQANTIASIQHSNTIIELSQSVADMKKEQKNE